MIKRLINTAFSTLLFLAGHSGFVWGQDLNRDQLFSTMMSEKQVEAFLAPSSYIPNMPVAMYGWTAPYDEVGFLPQVEIDPAQSRQNLVEILKSLPTGPSDKMYQAHFTPALTALRNHMGMRSVVLPITSNFSGATVSIRGDRIVAGVHWIYDKGTDVPLSLWDGQTGEKISDLLPPAARYDFSWTGFSGDGEIFTAPLTHDPGKEKPFAIQRFWDAETGAMLWEVNQGEDALPLDFAANPSIVAFQYFNQEELARIDPRAHDLAQEVQIRDARTGAPIFDSTRDLRPDCAIAKTNLMGVADQPLWETQPKSEIWMALFERCSGGEGYDRVRIYSYSGAAQAATLHADIRPSDRLLGHSGASPSMVRPGRIWSFSLLGNLEQNGALAGPSSLVVDLDNNWQTVFDGQLGVGFELEEGLLLSPLSGKTYSLETGQETDAPLLDIGMLAPSGFYRWGYGIQRTRDGRLIVVFDETRSTLPQSPQELISLAHSTLSPQEMADVAENRLPW